MTRIVPDVCPPEDITTRLRWALGVALKARDAAAVPGQWPAWARARPDGEDVPAVAPYRADLGPAGDSRTELDAVVGRLMRVLEHLHAAHRG